MSDMISRPSTAPSLTQGHSSEKHKINLHMLSPADSDSYARVSNSSSPSHSASWDLKGLSGLLSDKQLELPVHEESVDALEFVGFTRPVASEIYQRWITCPDLDQYPYSFIDHAGGQYDWRRRGDISYAEYMTKVGLKQEIQDAILDPKFAKIFETETLEFWITDTLESRHKTIDYLNRRINDITMHGGRNSNSRKTTSTLRQDTSTCDRGQVELSSGIHDSTKSLSMSTMAKGLNFPRQYVRFGDAVGPLHDHCTLYKGCFAETNQYLPLVESDGSLDLMNNLQSTSGDFNHPNFASYWTPEKETAELYREYAQRRNLLAETCIISIQVPLGFIGSLSKMSLWYSADWKEYVWYCRKKRVAPKKFKKLSKAKAIQGHICRKLPQIVSRIKPEDVQTTIDDSFCLRYQGTDGKMTKCTQLAFLGGETVEKLAEVIRGKMHIEVHASAALKES